MLSPFLLYAVEHPTPATIRAPRTMGNPCAILLLIVFSYRCPATHRGRPLPVLYRIPHALMDWRFSIVGAYRVRFSAETWKPGPWPLNRGALPIARHAWPVARGPWCVAGCRCAVRRAPCAVRRGPWFASIDSRAVAPWRVARGAWCVRLGARMMGRDPSAHLRK